MSIELEMVLPPSQFSGRNQLVLCTAAEQQRLNSLILYLLPLFLLAPFPSWHLSVIHSLPTLNLPHTQQNRGSGTIRSRQMVPWFFWRISAVIGGVLTGNWRLSWSHSSFHIWVKRFCCHRLFSVFMPPCAKNREKERERELMPKITWEKPKSVGT